MRGAPTLPFPSSRRSSAGTSSPRRSSAPFHRVRYLVLLLAAIHCGCPAARQPIAPPPIEPGAGTNPRDLTPLERYQVLRGTADEVMALVENDTDAGDTFLREPSQPVTPGDPVIAHLTDRMLATVQAVEGVGIAAVQVGIGRRVVLVQRFDREGEPFEALLNPEFLDLSAESAPGWEGCLSIPAGHGEVERSTSVTVQYDTPDGRQLIETLDGFTAVILQHELDHLDGTLFIDRTITEPLMPKDDYREMRERERELSD